MKVQVASDASFLVLLELVFCLLDEPSELWRGVPCEDSFCRDEQNWGDMVQMTGPRKEEGDPGKFHAQGHTRAYFTGPKSTLSNSEYQKGF